jgi:hypothetical protein
MPPCRYWKASNYKSTANNERLAIASLFPPPHELSYAYTRWLRNEGWGAKDWDSPRCINFNTGALKVGIVARGIASRVPGAAGHDEVVEPGLLLQEVFGGRLGGLQF